MPPKSLTRQIPDKEPNLALSPSGLALLFAGLLALYTPTYMTLYDAFWPQEHYSHGALIPLIFLVLVYRKRADITNLEQFAPNFKLGASLLLSGLVLLTIGRRASLIILETTSQIPVLFGVSLLLGGVNGFKALRFPVLFLSFMIPLPGIIMYQLTSWLKLRNAELAVDLLYQLNYPVALDGVVITISPYRLFLADACAGINSLYALAALGTVMIYLTKGLPTRRKAVLCLGLVPLALLSNYIRVITLLLLTYHVGDTFAEKVHESVGYIMFALSMLLLVFIENKVHQVREY